MPAKAAPPDARQKKSGQAKPAEEEKNWYDQWLEECYAGQHRPAWTSKLIAPLEKMLTAAEARERAIAALDLVALGKSAQALPVLTQTVSSHPEAWEAARNALPWLTWQKRMETFRQLRLLAADELTFAQLVEALSEVPDRHSAEPLWELLADAKLSKERASPLMMGLLQAYFGERYYSQSEVSPAARRKLAEAAKRRVQSGGDLQRLVALLLLAAADQEQAAQTAAQMADDAKLAAWVRADAFQVQLAALGAKQSRAVALTALKDSDTVRKKIALKRLSHGQGSLAMLPPGLYLPGGLGGTSYSYHSAREGKPIVPKPPPGIVAAHVRPLITDADPEVAASAGYLLALLGEADGLPPLLKYWRQHGRKSEDWDRLVYRAIATIDDPQYIDVLRQIYDKLDRFDVGEFYWTIRIMSGPEILKFRKEIRDRVDLSNAYVREEIVD
jgi:hypothetical protein